MPLLSASASGTFAKAITFTKRKVNQVGKFYSKPGYKRSAAQASQRLRFSACQIVWNALTPAGKNLWSHFRRILPWCKNNPFIKMNLSTGYPCREAPEIPGLPYSRKSEWIVGLATIGVTPIGTKLMWKLGWQ